MVAEYADEFIWEWMKVKQDADLKSHANPNFKVWWKGFVSRAFVESTAYWAKSRSEGINDALALFVNHLVPSGKAMGIPLIHSGVGLMKRLISPRDKGIDASLYKRFASTVRVWDQDAASRKFNLSRLALDHPSDPDPFPALREK